VFLERSQNLLNRLTEARASLEAAEAGAAQAEVHRELRHSIAPKVRSALERYAALSTPAEKNALLKTVLERVIYRKSKGGRYAESDMQVHVFPALPREDGV
jgi:hypothetical protein